MSNTQEKIKKEIEKDFEYCVKAKNKSDFEFYYTYCYALVMGSGFYENNDELGKWWDEIMREKFIKNIKNPLTDTI